MVPTDSLVIYWHGLSMGMASTAYRIHTDVTVPGRNSVELASVYSQEYASQFASQYAHEVRPSVSRALHTTVNINSWDTS